MSVAFAQLGDMAAGSIEPGDAQQKHLEEFTQRVGGGEFHVPVNWPQGYGKMLLARCVDGRLPEDTSRPLVPNSAGGTISLFVADDLTEKRFAGDGTTRGGLDTTATYLRENGYETGGHTDDHAEGSASGCGANDKLDVIYTYIAERGDTLRAAATDLGITVPDDAHRQLVENAAARSQFSPGRELLEILEANSRPQLLDPLVGAHKEVLTVVNMRPGTTFDRVAARAAFGEDYQAFNVDAWAFGVAAKAVSAPDVSDDLVKQKVAAIMYYNLATALVLVGPKMRLTILQ